MVDMADRHEQGQRPSGWLVENIELLPSGRVLDVAMGRGRNAIYLAQLGFEVEGVDVSAEAVSLVEEAARDAGVAISAKVADLEAGYKIEAEAYDVIICFNYLQRSLVPDIKNGLKNGGVVVYETFIIDQARYGRPSNPDYLLEHNELLEMFRDFRCLRYREGIMDESRALAAIVAVKV